MATFHGNAQPKCVIEGPGADAFKVVDGTDRATYLVSPGVFDCAILTVVLPRRPVQGGIGSHRGEGARAMAHYNPFSGPRQDGIKLLFDSILRSHAAAENDLQVAISHHASARYNNYDKLATLIGAVIPNLVSLTMHSYGATAEGQKRQPVTIYLAPNGQISGTSR